MRSGFVISFAALMLIPVSVAASRTTDAAQAAVRDLILSSTGASRVFLADLKESRLSSGETRVTGEGVTSDRAGWGGVPFRFSIIVRDSDLNSRGGIVELKDGRKLTAQNDWGRHISPQGYDLAFSSPRWYETVGGQDVRFSGRSNGPEEVRLSIYDRSGRMVREGRAAPDRSGQWSAIVRLDQGDYRAVAHRKSWSDGDEVRFAVGRASGNWGEGSYWTGYRQRGQWDRGWMESTWGSGGWGSGGWQGEVGPSSQYFRITSPRQNEVVRENGVIFRGTSSESVIMIRVYEGGRRIQNERVTVDRNREWQRTITLSDGRYRAEIESGRDTRTLDFEVRGRSGGPLGITSPRQNEVVRENGVIFRGTSSESVIMIRVYEGGRRIQNERVPVDRNREWQRTITLSDGRYRAEIESGRDTRTLDFEVRGRSGGPLGITSPRQNEVVRENGVIFRGTSSESVIMIRVYEGGRRIQNERVPVDRNREWQRTITLSNGRYRAEIESGRDTLEISFQVRT